MADSSEQPHKRRRVFMTAGLTASAAVLAMSIQAGSLGDDEPAPTSYSDAAPTEPDETS